MSAQVAAWRERRDDAQSQLDALCGECPDVCAQLEREIAELTGLINREYNFAQIIRANNGGLK